MRKRIEPEPYRLGKGLWADHEEPDFLAGPGEGLIFFGANPSWSPADESQSPYTCRRCGGKGLIFPIDPAEDTLAIPFRFDSERHAIVTLGDDPIRSGRVCAGCVRWSRDAILRRLTANGPVPVAIPDGGAVPLAIDAA